MPHHIVLSKLPLVRFCQPNDPGEVRYWYELLGSINVTFAVCSANGRVLAAIDLDTDRGNSRRILQIKQSVLGACRVRYSALPGRQPALGRRAAAAGAERHGRHAAPQTSPSPPTNLDEARDSLASTVASRRAQRTALWQDSSRFQDSFFAPDSRQDGFGSSEYPHLPPAAHSRPRAAARTGTHSQPGALNGLDRPGDSDDGEEAAPWSSIRAGAGVVLALAALSRARREARSVDERRDLRRRLRPHPTPTSPRPRCSTRSTASACAATAGCCS